MRVQISKIVDPIPRPSRCTPSVYLAKNKGRRVKRTPTVQRRAYPSTNPIQTESLSETNPSLAPT